MLRWTSGDYEYCGGKWCIVASICLRNSSSSLRTISGQCNTQYYMVLLHIWSAGHRPQPASKTPWHHHAMALTRQATLALTSAYGWTLASYPGSSLCRHGEEPGYEARWTHHHPLSRFGTATDRTQMPTNLNHCLFTDGQAWMSLVWGQLAIAS